MSIEHELLPLRSSFWTAQRGTVEGSLLQPLLCVSSDFGRSDACSAEVMMAVLKGGVLRLQSNSLSMESLAPLISTYILFCGVAKIYLGVVP
jgi:hypothetical protein